MVRHFFRPLNSRYPELSGVGKCGKEPYVQEIVGAPGNGFMALGGAP